MPADREPIVPNQTPRRRSGSRTATLLTLVLSASLAAAASAGGIRLEPVVNVGNGGRLLALADPDDGSGRLFLVQQSGEIWIWNGAELLEKPFLDLSRKVKCCTAEQGLLDLAFHPDYASNGLFFVTYNAQPKGDSVVARFSVSNDPDRANAGSEVELIRQPKPEPVHNVGNLEFGPDGYLYIGAGDGGIRDNGQDLETLFGKILRIDVDRGRTYQVPPDNPFVGDPDALDEIWVWGLRNPWRFSLDRATGDLFIGDVGAAEWEEVDYLPAGAGGANFGWAEMEASHCTDGGAGCNADGSLTLPFFEYAHVTTSCSSVTGGYRYRGPKAPTLAGSYLFADFCRRLVWAARQNLAGNWVVNQLLKSDVSVSSFGEDAAGNLYLTQYGGKLFRIVGDNLFADDFDTGDTSRWSRRRGGLETVAPGLKRSEFALELPLDGRRLRRYLSSREPTGESTFRASFLLKLERAELGGGKVAILHLEGAESKAHTTLAIGEAAGRHWLELTTRDATGPPAFQGRVILPRKRPVQIQLDWLRASAPGRADGQVLISKNGKVRIRATGLENPAAVVNQVLLGLVSGAAGSRGGSILIDRYASSP